MSEDKKSEGTNEHFERRADISRKFIDMGLSLTKEGDKIGSYEISSSGSIMMLLAGLILDTDDIEFFSKMCSMFSAKKVLDTMPSGGMFGNNEISDRLRDIIDNMDDNKGDED